MKETYSNGGYFSPWFHKMITSGLLDRWWREVEKGDLVDIPESSEVVVLE